MHKVLRALSLVGGLVVAATAVAAQPAPRTFVTHHVAQIAGHRVPYVAAYEEFVVDGERGEPAASLFATSYVREGVEAPERRPVVFVFNGGPSAAAYLLHMQLGPRHEVGGPTGPIAFADNPDSLLDVADLVMFDPAETGASRVLSPEARPYFYSTAGDAAALSQLVAAWLKRHGRETSPRYLLGESYGSIRLVVAGDLLSKQGLPLDGDIVLGDSIFLQETARRTHNIISPAVSLPVLALTAAYHGKVDKGGKSDAAFLDEVYAFAIDDYLPALAKGYTLAPEEQRRLAGRLASYTSIPADYFLGHGLTITKPDFYRMLLPGKVLDVNDTRIAQAARPAQSPPAAESEELSPKRNIYTAYLRDELKVDLPGSEYRYMAPDAFETWNWGNACSDQLLADGLCSRRYGYPSVFSDYDWPEVLKRQYANPRFRVMVIAGYYDGQSTIGTHRYLQAQLGYPSERFELREYPAGHATAEDPNVRPRLVEDVKRFLSNDGAAR